MRLRRLLQLREGEGEIVALAVAAAFLSSGGTMVAQSAIDALFFTQYGVDRLPAMYLILGPTMFVATVGVTVLLARTGRGRAFVAIPLALLLVAVAGRAALETEAGWLYGGLWVIRNVAEMMQVLTVWGLAGLVTDTRQAKRFFPLIAAGGIFGLISGGFATRPLAGAMGPENLILVWGAALGCVAVIAWRLVARAGAGGRPPRLRRGGGSGDLLRVVRRSGLLRWLAAGSVLTSALFSLLYLPFSGAAVERYPDPDDLAGFFGTFFALATGTAFVVSLLVTGRLLRRFGMPTVVLVLPLLYLAAFGVLTFAATFAALTLFRFLQVAWSGGGGNSAWEALVNVVPPNRRDQVRAFLYGVPTQLGTIAAGVVALIAQTFSQPRVLYVAGLFVAALAVLSIARLRREYPSALVEALREGRPNVFGGAATLRSPATEPDAATLTILMNGLADSDPRVRQLAAHGLGEVGGAAARTALAGALGDREPVVRAAAVDALAVTGLESPDPILLSLADSDADVRFAAMRALAAAGASEASTRAALRRALTDADVRVRAHAAALLVRQGENGAGREALASVTGSHLPHERAAGFEAIGFTVPPGVDDLVFAGLEDVSPAVRSAAIRALEPARVAQEVPRLVALLASDDPAVVEAAGEALRSARSDGIPADHVREFVTEAVQRALSDHELARGLRLDTPPLRLLHDSLVARAERHALQALRAVALLGDHGAVAVALESVSVSDPAQRANAIEVIEAVGEARIVRPLLTLWEAAPARGDRHLECLERLRQDPDDWIRACADWAAGAERTDVSKTLQTVPLLERVLSLRNVPLFAELAPQDLRPIAEVAEEHEFAEGETIGEKGEAGHATYVIVKGEVEVVDVGEAGEPVPVGVRRDGEVIGEMAVLSDRPRMASLVARTPVRVLVIARNEFQSILRERPEAALALIRVLCDRLEDRPGSGPSE